jgi:hypothetical protein
MPRTLIPDETQPQYLLDNAPRIGLPDGDPFELVISDGLEVASSDELVILGEEPVQTGGAIGGYISSETEQTIEDIWELLLQFTNAVGA